MLKLNLLLKNSFVVLGLVLYKNHKNTPWDFLLYCGRYIPHCSYNVVFFKVHCFIAIMYGVGCRSQSRFLLVIAQIKDFGFWTSNLGLGLGIIVKPKSEVPKSKVPKSKVPKSRPKGLLIVKVAQIGPLTHPAKKIDQLDSKIKEVGSPTCSRSSLSINPNF